MYANVLNASSLRGESTSDQLYAATRNAMGAST